MSHRQSDSWQFEIMVRSLSPPSSLRITEFWPHCKLSGWWKLPKSITPFVDIARLRVIYITVAGWPAMVGTQLFGGHTNRRNSSQGIEVIGQGVNLIATHSSWVAKSGVGDSLVASLPIAMPRRPVIQVWICCHCGLRSISIGFEYCPDCCQARCPDCLMYIFTRWPTYNFLSQHSTQQIYQFYQAYSTVAQYFYFR